MLVRMHEPMSGTINGEPWPATGCTIDLPDAVANKVIASGQGEAARPKSRKRPAPAADDDES